MHVLLRFEPACFGAQLKNREAGTIVDEYFCFGQFGSRGGQAREVAFAQKSIAHLLQIYAGTRAKKTLNKLLAAHFQAEDAHGKFFVYGDMLGDVHGERGLAHARTRRDNDHFRRVHPARHAVKLNKSR